MPIVPVAFVDLAIITRALMKAELDKVRAWLNHDATFLIADVIDAEITHHHIYKPDLHPFPRESAEGTFQSVYDRHFGIDLDNAGLHDRLALRQVRQTIFLRFLSDDDSHFLGKMQARVRVQSTTGDVEVSASWACTATYDYTVSALIYPDPGGEFVLAYRDVATGVETILTESIREMYPRRDASGVTHNVNTYDTGAYIEGLAKGDYDVYVKYQREGASADLTQVVMFDQNFVAEVHTI